MRSIILALFILTLTACQSSEKTGETAFVVAKSEEMNKLAEDYISKKQWKHSNQQKATRIVIVIRTADQNPLSETYATLSELEKAADSKLDKTSNAFVIYSFAQDDKHKLSVVEKISIDDPLLKN